MRALSIPIACLAALLASSPPGWAQTANSSGGAGSATQFSSGGTMPQGGNIASGAANGQNSQPSSGGNAGTGTSKIGAPTAVEQREQQKSDKDTKICTGC